MVPEEKALLSLISSITKKSGSYIHSPLSTYCSFCGVHGFRMGDIGTFWGVEDFRGIIVLPLGHMGPCGWWGCVGVPARVWSLCCWEMQPFLWPSSQCFTGSEAAALLPGGQGRDSSCTALLSSVFLGTYCKVHIKVKGSPSGEQGVNTWLQQG